MKCGICSESNPLMFSKNQKNRCKKCQQELYRIRVGKTHLRNYNKIKIYSIWSRSEETLFKQEYPFKSITELMKLLNKSESSIKNKAKEFKLRKYANAGPILTLCTKNLENQIISGVYIIKNTTNNKFYVGSSSNIYSRLAIHLSKLNSGSHKNNDLQADWNNKDEFVFFISYRCDILRAENIEHEIVHTYLNTDKIYNKAHINKQPYLNQAFRDKFIQDRYQDNPNLCWEYSGHIDKDGYGIITIDKHEYRIHRISYFIYNEEWPNGNIIMHQCNNKKCLNPHHLKIGSNKENADHYHQSSSNAV